MRIAMLALLLVGAAAARDDLSGRYDVSRLGIAGEEVPFCMWRDGGWVCTPASEPRTVREKAGDRAAPDKEIAALRDEVAALKRQLAAVEEPLPAPRGDQVTSKPRRHGVIARIGACLQYTWRRVVDMIVGAPKDARSKG